MATFYTIKVEGVDRLTRQVDPNIVRLSNFRAIARTRVTMAKVIRQKVRERFFVKASRVTKDLKRAVPRKHRDRSVLRLVYIGKRLNLASFSATRRKVQSRLGARYAATVRVLRGGKRKIVRGTSRRGGFIGTRNNVKLVFERTGTVRTKPRYRGDQKLRAETGPAVAQMIRSVKVIRHVQQVGIARYQQVMQHELQFRIAKAAR